jgi:hypothetical protein
MLAKMGLAMPDGSFYIRNGPVGASDLENAIKAVGRGEDGNPSSGDPIRKHIMKRAADLKLSGKIPGTWNPDGSLKHDWTDEVEEYLAHYGVKGMQWRSTAQRQAAEATATAQGQKGVQAAKKANAAKKADKHQLHVLHLAHLLKLSKDLAGKHAKNVKQLKATGQRSKISAANAAHAAAQAQLAARARLVANAATGHSAFDDEFLAHFGVRGMKWGLRRPRGTASADDHPGSPDALRAKATMDTIRKHGLKAVSTADLQHLVSRQNLEKQHGSLNPEHVNAGRKAVSDILVQVGKQQASALATKAVTEGLKKLTEAKS